MASTAHDSNAHGPFLAILIGGFVAGTLDIGAAALISSMSPVRILKVVAGGLLGRTALDGGTGVAALGMVLQWAMSLIIAAVYVIAARRVSRLRVMWVRGGIAYGVVVFAVMNYWWYRFQPGIGFRGLRPFPISRTCWRWCCSG